MARMRERDLRAEVAGLPPRGRSVQREDKEGIEIQGKLASKNIRAMAIMGASSSQPTGVDWSRRWASKVAKASTGESPQLSEERMMYGFAIGKFN